MSLSQLPNRQISRLGSLISIVFTGAILVWFNFYPETVGFVRDIEQPDKFVPILAPAFSSYLLALNPWWVASILLSIIHVVLGRWVFITWVADMLVRVFGLFVIGSMLTGQAFVLQSLGIALARLVLLLTAFGLVVGLIVQVEMLVRDVTFSAHPQRERKPRVSVTRY